MTFDNDERLRSDAELSNRKVRSDGSLRGERSMAGSIAGFLALAVIAMAVMFLLPNRTDTTATNSGTTNSGTTMSSPASIPPATTTGSGSTTPAAPTTVPSNTR